MDGGQDKLDCNGASHAIDGWYDDSAGSRWNAHSVPTHVKEFTVGSAAVHDLLALKAAHDVIPLEPDDPDLPDYDAGHSKSKTATNLEKQEDGTYTSEVTLSLPSAQEELVTDVVFVLDKSTSPSLEAQALAMLSNLQDQVVSTGATVKVGVVIFNKVANVANDGNFFDLATQYDGIKAAIEQDISSGTNTHAGLLAGKAMLDGDDSVSADRKYLIFVSDGITYMYNAEPTATAWSFNQPNSKDDWYGPGSFGTFAGPDNWYSKYHTNNGPSSWSEWLSTVAAQVATQGTTYEYPYGGTIITATPEDRENWDKNYAMSIDKALYLTYQTYQEAVSAGYHCYSVVANTGSGGEYTWGPSFMTYLAGGNTVSFDDIQKDIYYLLAAGTKVEDYMGYVADDYNFDFVADGLTMKVGEQTYEAVSIGENKYGFAPNEENAYAYTLTYVPGDQKGSEHFVWEINVPVSNFAPVQLTYTVKLVNPKTAEGTYGQYDADGSEGLDSLYTNNSATLYPVDSNDTEGLPENFPKPTVSYTVAQETGTLTVQKIVADNVEDWSFDFAVTIGGNAQNVTLTKNSPTWTSGPIALGTEYEVKEVDAKGYQVTSTNATGTITENSSAVFVNMPVDTGVLTISKTVEGQKNPTEKFTFTVNLPEGEYPYIYSTAQGNNEVSGYISDSGTVTLSSGQSVSIYGLPVGASYTVTETANDDYTVSAEAIHGTVDGAVVSGTIPDLDDGAAAAHYTNTYHGSWIPPVKPVTPIRPPVDPDKPELNTEDHYAYIVGYEDGSVQPEGDITRAEVATIFFRLLTDESRDAFWSQTNDYTDVPADAWYNNAVSTLSNAGIIDGYEDGTFKPDGNITRAEFATIAVRFFEATYDGGDLFSDIAGHWAQDYINEAANAGIVDGYPDGTFRPQQYITRAEAMTMVNRTIDRHPDADHLLDDMIVWPDNPETAWYYEQVQEATNSHEYTMNT
ncbi:S-layer homology domain-containing protein, partial [Evtepia sp.]|uniref:S-layer homology domain-containing protein n=1 Tax=Evtepia sp. TaxID=2773933 RepID=UPI002E79E1F0